MPFIAKMSPEKVRTKTTPSPYQVRTKSAPSPLDNFAVSTAKMQVGFASKRQNPMFFSPP